jgi:hypothetical protein
MNNLIITVIAISLCCVISMIGIFYGGQMFLGNQYGAAAPAVVEIGEKVASAWQSYEADKRPASPGAYPTTWATLLSNGYLRSLPMVPPMPGAGLNVSGTTYNIAAQNQGYIFEDSANIWYYVADVGRPTNTSAYATDTNGSVCKKILAQLNISTISGVSNITDATLNNLNYGNGTYGCFFWQGGATYNGNVSDNPNSNNYITGSNDYMFFYRLGN